jgi:recombinational DNA repair protein RecR
LRAALVAFGGTAAFAARANERVAQEKIAQKIVQYQDTPKNNQICMNCVNFEAPNACKIVAGTINPNGWCIAFAPKAS